MPSDGLVARRLRAQRLTGAGLPGPAAVVSWLGAVQAQDYGGASWGVAQRAAGAAAADVTRAFDRGAILRTHVLRPTWHFVSPADIRWLLALTGPRVHAGNASRYRQLELDPATLARGRRVMERALERERYLTRGELGDALQRAGIEARGERLAHLVLYAELHGAICSGPERGRHLTYALLDERVPPRSPLSRDEALAEIVRRYFASHGPATFKDFAWWSGLTLADARRGAEANGRALVAETIEGLVCWSTASRREPGSGRRERSGGEAPEANGAWLLPNYDEYLIAYRDRGFVVPASPVPADAGWPAYPHHVVIDGRLAGAWARRDSGRAATIEVRAHRRFTRAESRAVAGACERYGTVTATLIESIRIR